MTTPLPSAVERLETVCAAEWPDPDFVEGCDKITFGDLRLLLSTLKARPGVEEVAEIIACGAVQTPSGVKLVYGDEFGHDRFQPDWCDLAKAQAILALFPASVGGGLPSIHAPALDDVTVCDGRPELPCAETGPNSPSSPDAPHSDGGRDA